MVEKRIFSFAKLDSANAETISNSILDTLLLCELNTDNLIAHGYEPRLCQV